MTRGKESFVFVIFLFPVLDRPGWLTQRTLLASRYTINGCLRIQRNNHHNCSDDAFLTVDDFSVDLSPSESLKAKKNILDSVCFKYGLQHGEWSDEKFCLEISNQWPNVNGVGENGGWQFWYVWRAGGRAAGDPWGETLWPPVCVRIIIISIQVNKTRVYFSLVLSSAFLHSKMLARAQPLPARIMAEGTGNNSEPGAASQNLCSQMTGITSAHIRPSDRVTWPCLTSTRSGCIILLQEGPTVRPRRESESNTNVSLWGSFLKDTKWNRK